MSDPHGAPLVVHVIRRLDYGGMETMLIDLINRMGDTPYRHAVICLKDYTGFRDRIASPAVEVFTLGKREGKDLISYWRLWRLLRRLRPALVNTYNLATLDVAPFARLAGCRVVHAEHGWEAGREAVPSKYIRLRQLMRPFIDRFVAVSNDLQDWLRDTVGVSAARVVCIHNGVDDARFLRDASERLRARERLGIEEKTFVIGTVARLDPVKAQTLLVEAIGKLSGDPGSRAVLLLMVGEGPERGRLEALIRTRELDHLVQLIGARDDVPELLNAFDVFALPSCNEGVSIAVLEAMAAELPIVATRVGGNPEVVADGETGLLVVPGDAEALAAALARYRDDAALALAHGKKGRARMRSEFSLDSMVQRYLRLYDELLNRRSPLTLDNRAT